MTRFRFTTTAPTYQPGDLIGFSHSGCLGWSINLVTGGVPGWGLSHVAMVAGRQQIPGRIPQLVLFESTMSCRLPCLIQRQKIAGVQAHDIGRRIRTYPGRVWHYPLVRRLRPMTAKWLSAWWVSRLGCAYDAPGAIQARGWGWIERRLRAEDLTSLFCSEACAAAWRYVGLLPTGNASKWSPNALARAAASQGITAKPRRLK